MALGTISGQQRTWWRHSTTPLECNWQASLGIQRLAPLSVDYGDTVLTPAMEQEMRDTRGAANRSFEDLPIYCRQSEPGVWSIALSGRSLAGKTDLPRPCCPERHPWFASYWKLQYFTMLRLSLSLLFPSQGTRSHGSCDYRTFRFVSNGTP